MILARPELLPFAIPLRTPLRTAYGDVTARRGIVVVLRDAAGHQGIGEATPHPALPVGDAVLLAELSAASSWLAGADLGRLDTLLAAAQRLSRPAAMAVDMALYDLAARATGRSVAALLGGPVRRAVPASALLPDGAADMAAARALARGFRAGKVKIGPDVEAAVAGVAAIRAAAPGLALRCDANGAWDAETAVRVARRLAALGVAWLEQPVAAGDAAGLTRVRREGGVAVAADESITGPDAVERLAGAADVAVVKLVQVGGLAAARAVATAARRHGMRLTVTTGLETSIATAAALHLAAALPDPLEDCGLATTGLLVGDLVMPALAGGPSMTSPPGPGLGVELDRDAVRRWRAA